jgi:SAM-dependent methyltransferase
VNQASTAVIQLFTLLLLGCGVDSDNGQGQTQGLASVDGRTPRMTEQIEVIRQAIDEGLGFLELRQNPDGSWPLYMAEMRDLTDAEMADPLWATLAVIASLRPRGCSDREWLCLAEEYAAGRLQAEEACALGSENVTAGAWVLADRLELTAALEEILPDLFRGGREIWNGSVAPCAWAAAPDSPDLGATFHLLGYLSGQRQDTTELLASLRALRATTNSWGEIDPSLPLPAVAHLAATVRGDEEAPAAQELIPGILGDLDEWSSRLEFAQMTNVDLAAYLALKMENCRSNVARCGGSALSRMIAQLMRARNLDLGWPAEPLRTRYLDGKPFRVASSAVSTAIVIGALDRFYRHHAEALAELQAPRAEGSGVDTAVANDRSPPFDAAKGDSRDVHSIYDARYSGLYDELWYQEQRYKWEINQIDRQIKIPHAEVRLLDSGCGTGTHYQFLSDSYQVVGMDISADMLKIATDKSPDGTFVLGDMRDTSLFDAGAFTHIMSMYQSSFYAKDLSGIASNYHHWLRVGGLLFLEIIDREVMRRIWAQVDGPRRAVLKGGGRKESWWEVAQQGDTATYFERIILRDGTRINNDHTLYLPSVERTEQIIKTAGFRILERKRSPFLPPWEWFYVFEKVDPSASAAQ